MIRLEHITKTYVNAGKKFNAADDVSLEIKKGEIFGIIGFSGAGKSTLVRCINLLERPDSGRVFINDKDITALRGAELRRQRKKIGMIFQHFNLFASRTVLQNVIFPIRYNGLSAAERRKKALELLKLVGIADKAGAYPSELSGGQKQRAAIARALASDPEILLCDEATSALDPQTTEAILKLLKSLNAKLGLTIVLITHQMNVVKEICDRTAVMENGRVVEQGDVFEIFANPQQPVTRAFVDTTSCLSGINTLIEEKSPLVQLKPGQKILRFKYLERSACEALVSTISRKFNVDLNIVFGSIEIIGDNPIGGLVVIADGNEIEFVNTSDFRLICRSAAAQSVKANASNGHVQITSNLVAFGVLRCGKHLDHTAKSVVQRVFRVLFVAQDTERVMIHG